MVLVLCFPDALSAEISDDYAQLKPYAMTLSKSGEMPLLAYTPTNLWIRLGSLRN
jgi:hypothetical protein